MSNIPSSAVSAAFVPVQRSTNELIRARQVQSRKNSHHSEEVEELDDTAVNSVGEQNQRQGSGTEEEARREEGGERVDIDSLKQMERGPEPKESGGEIAGLDISA